MSDKIPRSEACWPVAFRSWMLGCAFLPALISAQSDELDLRRLSIEDGLSHSRVWAIEQDARGFLWIGTVDGLNRYDGYGFKVYKNDPDDADSISANEVMALHRDRRGELWVGTRGGGLNRYVEAEERFVRYRHQASDPTSLSHDEVWWILEDRAGRLWVGTEGGLNRFDDARKTFTRFQHDPSDPDSLSGRVARVVFEDRAGQLWIGTENGLNRFDPATESFVHYLHDPADPDSLGPGRILALREDWAGRLWIGTLDGLYSFDPREEKFTRRLDATEKPHRPGLRTRRIISLIIDGDDTLWIGTRGDGLHRFAADTGSLPPARHHAIDPRTLSDDSVTAIFEDATGLIWIGTYSGLSLHDPRHLQFATYRNRPGRPDTIGDDNVAAIYEDRFGELWVGNYNSGLNRLDRDRRVVRRYEADPGHPGRLRDGTVTAVLEDRAGELWVGTWGGLHRFDRDGERFTRFVHDPADPRSLGDDVVLALAEDRSSRLWIGTFEGLYRFDPERRFFTRFPPSPGVPASLGEDAFYTLVEDRSGTLWFGADGSGLVRFDDDGTTARFTEYRHDPKRPGSLPGDRVASLHEDRMGRLWIGLRGAGLGVFDAERQRFESYREKDGLASDTVLNILEDDAGHLWLATTDGLSRFDVEERRFQNFHTRHGLQGEIFSSYAAHRSPSGEMFFGGPRGFNAFFPDQITTDPHPPTVVVTDFQLFNVSAKLKSSDPRSPLERSIVATRELVLSHRDYVFSFEFAALHFASPKHNRFLYRLDGFDREWISTTPEKRFAPYSNLKSGTYTFMVKASNADGVWSEEAATVSLRVRSAPWRSGWAYALYAAAFIVAVLLLARGQQRKLERERAVSQRLRQADKTKDALIEELGTKNAELERFTYTVSHDLKSPLVTIKGFLGMVKNDLRRGVDPAGLEHDLDRISAAADQMARLLEDLLELSRIGRVVHPAEKVSLHELAQEAVRYVAGAIAERGVEVVISEDLPLVYADRLRMLEVFQNLIENAVKFIGTQELPRVEIASRNSGGQTVVYVRDNGPGIDPQYHEKIFGLFNRLDTEQEGTGIGLALARRIVEVHGGRLWVESEGGGRGSTFCMTLPYQDGDRIGEFQ